VERTAGLLLRAAWVAPMDRPVIKDGGVLVSSGRVVAIGDAARLRRSHPKATEQDRGNAVLLPGLINPHVHLELTDVTRLAGDHWNGTVADWLIEIIKRWPQGDDAGRVARAVEAGVRQCLRFGVTTVGDITRQPGLTRPLLRESPLRVVSFGEIQAMARRRGLLDERLATAADRTHESGRLRVGLSPHAPYSVEAAGYERCVERSVREAYPITSHLAESADEATFLADHAGPLRRIWDFLQAWDDAVPRFAGGPIRFAKSVGLLDVPAVLAHVNYCDDDELGLLAAGRASVVYCPRTHAYFGHPPHRWREMLAAGVNVAIGTDSTASSPDLNLVDDLRLVRKLAPAEVPAIDLWTLATTRAAASLGMADDVGMIAPGKQADFVCFPVNHPADPLEQILREPIRPSKVWIAGEPVSDALR
jgi:cytosine/adenosine deaminase-related metal-dependent hydrolase